MLIRKCDCCSKPYQASPTGLMSLLCRPCADDCEVACTKIEQYYAKTGEDLEAALGNLASLSKAMAVPVQLIEALIKQGRLKKRYCLACNTVLGPQEQERCRPCIEQLAHQIKHAANTL